jgi:thioredoxin-related protein
MKRLSTCLLMTLGLVLGCGRSDSLLPENAGSAITPPARAPLTEKIPDTPVAKSIEQAGKQVQEVQPASIAPVTATDVKQAAAKPEPVAAELPAPKPTTSEQPAKKKREPIYDPEADAKALIAAAVIRAHLQHKHVLIEFGGNWCGWCWKLHDVFKSDETVHPIVYEEFELVLIDSQSNEELMKSYGGADRHFSYPHLTVLDGDGKVLTNQETGSLEIGPKHDPAKVAEFLKKWSPERLDAETLLAAALKQAAAAEKSVLVQFGTPYCGWCKVLTRFMYDHKPTFEQDYVSLRIDTVRMTHGEEVAERLKPSGNLGDPWMVILDPQGKVLVSSVGPKGNIGHPSAPEEIEHFLSMLKSTKKRLTDADLAAIQKSLNDAREERERKSQI